MQSLIKQLTFISLLAQYDKLVRLLNHAVNEWYFLKNLRNELVTSNGFKEKEQCNVHSHNFEVLDPKKMCFRAL